MTLESLGVLIAFITGLGAVIVSIRTSLNSVSQKELAAVHKENERLRTQITSLEKRIEDREAKISSRDERIDQLEQQVETLQFKMREVQQENELLRGALERYEAKKDTGELKQ
jgi:peptidoglycan hydrolase CwlO-like protein